LLHAAKSVTAPLTIDAQQFSYSLSLAYGGQVHHIHMSPDAQGYRLSPESPPFVSVRVSAVGAVFSILLC
jgi:hypothetical protein